MPALSVIIPAHNPDSARLHRTLLGLRAQTLASAHWECILVNSASTRFPDAAFFASCAPEGFRIVAEADLGLTSARRRGLAEAPSDLAVLVDDDNVLAANYLEHVVDIFARLPKLGAAGGKSLAEFERPPSGWETEFLPLLAVRDLGPREIVTSTLRSDATSRNEYPACAPIGAGMALRRQAWAAWSATLDDTKALLSDRRGTELTSSGDNDIVFCAMKAGWEVGYFPELCLTHLIPAGRLAPAYLARLNRGIQKSWMQVLTKHDANSWPPLSGTGASLRKMKAWLTYRAWSSPAARIRWQGACGHFDGRVSA